MTLPRVVPIFDGHNDVLLRLYRRGGTDAPRAFLEGGADGHLDLPKALQGGFAGDLFAVFVPSSEAPKNRGGDAKSKSTDEEPRPAPAVELLTAQKTAMGMVSILLRIARESRGRVRVCRSVSDIQQAIEQGALAAVLHMEGAEAIDPNFEFLDVLHAGGLRYLGPVWSRPNAFGHACRSAVPLLPTRVLVLQISARN
jgi:membrane dipeptidase